GPADAENVDDFWDERAQFVLSEYGEDVIDYHEKVADGINKLADLPDGAEVNLWFEYELFCSVNMWLCLDLMRGSDAKVFRVAPLNASPDDVWKGFGQHTADDLKNCFEARVEFTNEDIVKGGWLWDAFRKRESRRLLELGEYRSQCFPFLKEVCEAAAAIDTRPAKIIRELQAEGLSGLENIFPEFQKRAGVYGFGDLQVERLIENR
ncbi:MAG TPA: hypothetical protein VK612_03195, partial [Pyrinomonadaceae bacterium]|nr:hypothetical protein [Pyrinomonadaceae bacterium]